MRPNGELWPNLVTLSAAVVSTPIASSRVDDRFQSDFRAKAVPPNFNIGPG
jgi:hypothetical protein